MYAIYIKYRLARGLEHYKNKHKKPQLRKPHTKDKKSEENCENVQQLVLCGKLMRMLMVPRKKKKWKNTNPRFSLEHKLMTTTNGSWSTEQKKKSGKTNCCTS